jgi:hypothetical protein
VEPHPGSCAADTPVHLGDRNGSPRLAFDLVEESARNAWREGQHATRLARRTSRDRHFFVPERHEKRK